MNEERIRTTCPRDCYDSCGISVVRRNGRVAKVLGDPDHPISRGALCGKCALAYNGVWRDRESRLSQPLRRAGAKGSGKFTPVSWDAALDEIGERLRKIVDDDGADKILHTHYSGTCSLIAGGFPMRFFNRLGATEVDPDTICNNAGHVALGYLYGDSHNGFDPKTLTHSQCVLVWGANPSHSAPHIHKYWLRESSAKVIVVDPIAHETAQIADLHLQPMPGTDAALAFAFAHVARREGLCDLEFIRAHTIGWEEIEANVEACTPQWAEKVTRVPAALIEQAAFEYAKGPSLLWLGQGLQRQPYGGNVMRACGMLPALTGNLGKPGCGFAYVNGSGPRNIDGDYLEATDLRRTPASSISHMALSDVLQDASRSAALINWNMNIAASAPRQAQLRQALARKDLFTVVIDLFQTDTADFADIVLPAASFLEFDDLVKPYFYYYLSAQVKAEDPPGYALPNQEIFRRLAGAMGYNEPALYESDEDLIKQVLRRTNLDIEFEDLKEAGTIDPWREPQVQYADLRFATASGKIEIASSVADADGHPRTPQPLFDPPPENGCLRLLSPASKWQMNDSYGNDPNVRKTLGGPMVLLNGVDIEAFGVTEDGFAELVNDVGSMVFKVQREDRLPSGVALSYKGHWPKLDSQAKNVNFLNPGHQTDMGASSCVHGITVRVKPVSVSSIEP
ncbi:MAG: molybdopterin-dependent oxidoreductase [Gammaproteobacteria bacterium]|nr:molybdopterin-dependent oxidoreductase [Gammaproteobacteria bacterium]